LPLPDPKRLLVLATQTPFVRGGAERHVFNLVSALRGEGHEVDLLMLPFKFAPAQHHAWMMRAAEDLQCEVFSGHRVDGVISLLYPMWGAQHERHVSWIIHQHRAVYDLFGQVAGQGADADLKHAITLFDTRHLGSKAAIFANSRNVAARLRRFNGLDAEVLYHPPPNAEKFHAAEALPFIFCPSRIEPLKRQFLLLEAAAHLEHRVPIVFAGAGSQAELLRQSIRDKGFEERVRLLGHVSETEKITLFARCQAVFFAPQDEDLGYVTLEAMCASKPVITCEDSGGCLEFVMHGETGWVLPPDATAIAQAINRLGRDPGRAAAMGRAGRARYDALDLSWARVTRKLLSALFPGENS
jgi:glycosyltransferase involved in cell wall biosynthesis